MHRVLQIEMPFTLKCQLHKASYHHLNERMPISAWHTEWQKLFDESEVTFNKLPQCIKERRADAIACGGSVVLEFQHSFINKNEVDSRNNDYGHHGKRVIWVVDGNSDVYITHLTQADTYLLGFIDATWKYASFLSVDHVYIHIGDHVYRFAPSEVRCYMIDVRTRLTVDEFRDILTNGAPTAINMPWENDTLLPRSTLYLNQRGAGCGKTYESIQLITNNPMFSHKRRFIYLTMAHTAKTVIYDELVQQLEGAKLAVVPGSVDVSITGKQYRAGLTRSTDDAEITITIGTIDSFIYALADRSKANSSVGDMFQNMCDTIISGFKGYHHKSGGFRYGSSLQFLNRECLVVVDEAQDLVLKKLIALTAIARNTYIDIYVIGDKLQSIWDSRNVFTEGLPHTDVIEITPSVGVNIVRRFHNTKLMDFVNKCIDFERYGLSPIVGICDGKGCKYVHDDQDAVHLLEQPFITNLTNENIIASFVERLVCIIDEEVTSQKYLPHNFMFIFPIMKGNHLAARLETALNDFWIGKFANDVFRRDVLDTHEYWRNYNNPDLFHRHAFLHKSEAGQPINLDESRYATRLLSIHASKGQGCEIVFLLNATEGALAKFSKGEIDIIYESLLHVALTRQKKKLYIGVQSRMRDDIYTRFTGSDATSKVSPTILNFPRDSIKVSDIVGFVTSSKEWYDKMNDTYFMPRDLEDIVPAFTGGTDMIVEWGDHVIRMQAMYCTLLHKISQLDMDVANTSQLWVIMKAIADSEIRIMKNKKYYEALGQLSKKNRNIIQDAFIPVLEFNNNGHTSEYKRYRKRLVKIIEHIQSKLKDNDYKVPSALCPIEMCVIVHIQKVFMRGKYASSEFSIHELYRIMQCVRETPDTQHDGYNCICKDVLCRGDGNGNGNNNVQKSITNHHMLTVKVSDMFDKFMLYLRTTLGDDTPIKFNIDHEIKFKGFSDDFQIHKRLPVIATTDNNVVLIVLQPSFTRMQRDETFANALISTFLVRNSSEDSNNHKRFNGKRVSVCVFTFSSNEPVWLNIDYDEGSDIPIRDCITTAMKEHYNKLNEVLWEKLQECLRKSPLGLLRPVFMAMDKWLAEYSNDSNKVPKYVSKWLENAKEQSRKTGQCVVQSAMDIHDDLERRIREFVYPDDSVW